MKKNILKCLSFVFLGILFFSNNTIASESMISITSPSINSKIKGLVQIDADISNLINTEKEAISKFNFEFWQSNVIPENSRQLNELTSIGNAKCEKIYCSIIWDTTKTTTTDGLYNIYLIASLIKNDYVLNVDKDPSINIDTDNEDIIDNNSEIESVLIMDNYSSDLIPITVDNTAPVITINDSDNINIYQNSEYSDARATALDNIDGDITDKIISTNSVIDTNIVGSHIITYNVFDDAGNSAEKKTRTVNVIKKDPVRKNGGSSGSYIARQVVAPIIANPIVGQVLGAEKFIFTKFLKTGKIDNEVLELQKFLNANNFIVALTGPGSVGNETTKFGALTRQAVIKFQISRGLVGDGQVGAKTRAELNK